jgi:hypothetical protein
MLNCIHCSSKCSFTVIVENSWSDLFLYIQQIFCSQRIHHPDGGGNTHLSKVGVLEQDYTVLSQKAVIISV